MSKFHVNGEGNPGKCTAQAGNCPFGGEADHHSTAEAARAAFEASQVAVPAAQTKIPAQLGPGAVAQPEDLEAMPPASGVVFERELHRKGVDGRWYHGFGGSSRRSSEMAGAVVKENAAVPLLPTLETPELQELMKEVDQLQESFPPHISEVRGFHDAVKTLRTTGDSREYKFALDLLKLRLEDHGDFVKEELGQEASLRWHRAVDGAQRRLAQGW